MRRVLSMLGIGVLAGAGLFLIGVFVVPYISLWLMFGWLAL